MGDNADAAGATILIVDDDAAVCWALERTLAEAHFTVLIAADAAAARRRLRADVGLVITDIRMQGESGLDLLAALRRDHPRLPVVVMTAHGTMETAVEAVGRGAFDYLPKPIDAQRLLTVVRRALGDEPLAASARPSPAFDEHGIVGSSAAMQDVYRRVAAAAATEVPVLFTGPSGCGKEVLARALHRHSRRSAGPFLVVQAGQVGTALADLLAQAATGTVFLDEVDELPPAQQAHLDTVLASGCPTRVVAATRRDLPRLAQAGAFRDDLLWRLRSVLVAVPSVVERIDDLPELVRAFLARAATRLGRAVAISDAALMRLRAHAWPGNVRELKHVIEEAAVLATGGVVGVEHLPLPAAGEPPPAALDTALAQAAERLMLSHPGMVHAQLIDRVESLLVRVAMARTEGNQLRAAELLGINRATLKKRLDQAKGSA